MTNPREGKTWPRFVLGGRMRTSTLALIIAFIGIGWLYETYEPPAAPPEQVPATEVVPPGFIPDPAYTWAPRTDVQRRPPTDTSTETTPSTTPPSTTETSPTTPVPSAEPTGEVPGPPTASTLPTTTTAPGQPAPTSTPAPSTPLTTQAPMPSSARPTTPVPPAPTP